MYFLNSQIKRTAGIGLFIFTFAKTKKIEDISWIDCKKNLMIEA